MPFLGESLGSIMYEGIFPPGLDAQGFVTSGDIILKADTCPPGFRKMLTYKKEIPQEIDVWGCVRESLSPKAATFVPYAGFYAAPPDCPSGMVDASPWTQSHYWRVCKPQVDICAGPPPPGDVYNNAPMCPYDTRNHVYGPSPTSGKMEDCTRGGLDTAAPQCPPGSAVIVPRYSGGINAKCSETDAQRIARLAPWLPCGAAAISHPSAPTEHPELTTPVVLPEDVTTYFEKPPTPVTSVISKPVSFFGIDIPIVTVVAVGALFAYLLFGRKR